MTRDEALTALADPAAAPAALAAVAYEHPDLRGAVAGHPAAYPELRGWIAAQPPLAPAPAAPALAGHAPVLAGSAAVPAASASAAVPAAPAAPTGVDVPAPAAEAPGGTGPRGRRRTRWVLTGVAGVVVLGVAGALVVPRVWGSSDDDAGRARVVRAYPDAPQVSWSVAATSLGGADATFFSPTASGGVSATPTVLDDSTWGIMLNPGGSDGDARFVALDAGTGKVRWQTPPVSGLASCGVADASHVACVAYDPTDGVTALVYGLADGREAASFDLGDVSGAAPWFGDGVIVVGSLPDLSGADITSDADDTGVTVPLTLSAFDLTGTKRWTSSFDLPAQAGFAESPASLAATDGGLSVVSSGASEVLRLSDGHVVSTGHGGTVLPAGESLSWRGADDTWQLLAADGAVLRTFGAGVSISTPATDVASDDVVVESDTSAGTLTVVDATTGDDQWHVTLGDQFAYPVLLTDDVLVVELGSDTVEGFGRDGRVLWTHQDTEVSGYGAVFDGRRLLFTAGGRILALDAHDGTQTWAVPGSSSDTAEVSAVDGHLVLDAPDAITVFH